MGALRNDAVLLFVCTSVTYKICEIIRYVAAPGGERGFTVSTPTHLLTKQL